MWAGWVARILGIAALTPGGFFAFLISLLWVLFVSVWIYRAQAPATPAAV